MMNSAITLRVLWTGLLSSQRLKQDKFSRSRLYPFLTSFSTALPRLCEGSRWLLIVAVGRQRGFSCEEVTHQIQFRCRVGMVTVAQSEGDRGSTRPVIALFSATCICCK